MLLGTQYIPLLVSWKIPEYCGTVEAVVSQFFDKFSQIIAVFQLVARFLKSPSLHAFLSIFSQCVRSKEVLIFLLFHRSHLLWKIRKFWNHLKIIDIKVFKNSNVFNIVAHMKQHSANDFHMLQRMIFIFSKMVLYAQRMIFTFAKWL